MHFAVADFESSDWVNFEIIGFYDGKEFKVFDHLTNFLEYVYMKRYRGYTIYMHFGGKFDFNFLLEPLFKNDDKRIELIDNGTGRLIQVRIYEGDRLKLSFADSYMLLPEKLKTLCQVFKTKHQKLDYDIGNVKDFKSKESIKYLEHDCKGLYEVIDSFKDWGLNDGKLKLTLAAQAMYIYQNKFAEVRLKKLIDQDEQFIRQGYYGGRVEIFKTRGKNLFYYDVNSLYPYSMLNSMPCGNCVRVSRYISGMVGFYEIRVRDYKKFIPSLPVVYDRKLIFPCGTFKTFVTNIDIERLRIEQIDFDVLQGLVFEDSQPIFKRYVTELYDIKKKAKKDSTEYLISKLLLNSLYGKFGQRRDREHIVRELDYSTVVEKHLKVYNEEYALYLEETISKSPYICPYISSYITSIARNELYKWLELAGFDKVYYCDTDSIITTTRLPVGSELGQLKLESEISEAIFLQPKVYALKLKDGREICKIKGFQDNIMTFADFKNAVQSNDLHKLTSKSFRMVGIRENLKRFKDLKVRRIEVYKELRSIYDKRIVLDNGNTLPLEINS